MDITERENIVERGLVVFCSDCFLSQAQLGSEPQARNQL